MRESTVVTADEEAFCDALHCIYVLAKHEVPHTTLFTPLRDFCIKMGNEKLDKSNNVNYRSEQTMQEMLEAINTVLEAERS